MASSVHSSSSSWACATCTLLNPATKRRCQVCQSRKPVEQHQPSVVIDNNNSIVAIDITSPTRKKNNRKRKFPDKKKDGTTIATTDVKNSTNVKNSSIGDHQITAATIATIASSSTNKKTKKRQCMPRTSNDHVEKGDGIRSIRSSDGTNNKVNNDDANIHTINTTKENDNDSNITHRNVDESDAKSAAICAIIEDNITKVVKDTATNNSDKSNTRISCIESKAILCPDNTEYQQPQPQQDEQTTNEIQRSSNPDLIINRDTQQNLLQHFQHQQSNNNIDTNYGHPVDGGVELIEAPEKIVQEHYATTGSIDGQERQEQYNRLKGVDDDLNEIKMKACNERSENDNMLIIEKSEYNDAHTISMKGSSVTGSEGTMDDTTRCRSTQAQSNGKDKTSAHNTTTDITTTINQRTIPRMMVGNKPTRKEGIDNGKYDIPDRDMIRNNNAINNEELLSELDGDGLISPSHVSSPLIVNNANNGNKNNDGDDDTTDLPTTHGIGIHIIGNSCNTKKAKEPKENVSVDEISNEYSTKLQNKNSDALILTNDAKKEIGIVTINSLPSWKDFDNEKACSFPRNKTDDVGKDALHDKTIGTKNVQLIPKQRTRPQDDDTQQLHGSCDIEKVEHSRSSTQSKSLSLVCNFDYPMSTSFAYTPPGAETQSSQEGMADDDDDADNNDDVEENSAAEIRRSSPFYRHELSFKNDLDSNASSSPSKIKYQRMNDSLSSNTTVPNQYPDHLQVTKTNEKMHAVASKDDQRKLNIDPSGRSTNVSASANFNLGTSTVSETVPNPFSLFKTAGSGAFISVSKETVEEAERMLNKSFEIDSKIAIPEVPSRISKFPTAASALPSKRKSMNSFQTAGACNKVLASEHRSKDKLGKHLKNKTVLCNTTASASLPELSSSSTKNLFPSIAMKSESSAIFRTAGNGTEFILSEKSLERANGIFEISRGVKRPLNETNSGMILSAAAISTSKVSLDMFQKAGSVDAISMLDSRLHGKSLCSTESFRSSSTSGAVMKKNNSGEKSETVSTGTITFQPVGTGTTFSASNEKIIEMERVLNNTSVSSLTNPSALRTLSGESPPSGTMMRTFQTSKFDNATKFEPSRGGPKDIAPVSIPILQTADSGKAMYVCDKTVEEMGKMLETEPSSSSKPIIHPRGKKISAVAMGMFQTAGSGGAISVSNDKRTSRKESSFDRIKEKNVSTVAMGMFQTAGSGSAISVSNDKLEEMGRFLSRPSTSRKELSFDRIKEKNVPTAAMGMFQTAGSGGAISVSNDKCEEMGRLLNRPSTFRKESSFDEILKVKSVRNVKTSFASKGKVCTPVRGVMGTPHNRFIQIDSNISDEHRTIPPSFLSNNNQSFSTHIKTVPDSIVKEGFQAQSFAQGQSPRSPPKEFNMIPTRSANVTMSAGDGLLVRKRKGGQNGAITPVPISFIKNLDTVEEFEFAKFEKSTTPTSNVPNLQDCPTLLDAIRLGVMSKSPDICRRNGVSLETLGVNCENSLQLRFNNEGFPIASNDTLVSLGNLEDIRQALVENGCDSYKIKDSWIRNHTRLIVWKLAAYERSFSRFIGGNYLTYNRLIQNLTSRFQNETIEGVRPAIRKILNRDIAPSKMMILVVCRIIPAIESKHDNSSLPLRSLELSDGWYSVKGYLDKKLSKYVNSGLIKVGSKILISNARLMGSEEGIDPLDEGDGTNCDKCKSTLQLTANACRLARWNAKLGFVKATNNILISNGRLLIKRISDVFPGGGDIPAIRLFVERVYPLLFYEKTECNHPSHKKQILTAQEEDSRHREFENKKQKFYDKMIDKLRPEIERVCYFKCL